MLIFFVKSAGFYAAKSNRVVKLLPSLQLVTQEAIRGEPADAHAAAVVGAADVCDSAAAVLGPEAAETETIATTTKDTAPAAPGVGWRYCGDGCPPSSVAKAEAAWVARAAGGGFAPPTSLK